jgi:hypothetical protein
MALNKKANAVGITLLVILILILIFSLVVFFSLLSKKTPSTSSLKVTGNSELDDESLSKAVKKVSPDTDGDRISDFEDNCIFAYNPDQQDSDLDGIGDACDTTGVETSHGTSKKTIACSFDSDCGNNTYIGNPFCSANNVTQDYKIFTCTSPGKTNSSCTYTTEPRIIVSCPYQCSNATCISPPQNITCYSNSDCNDNNSSTTDTCNNPGTTSSYCTHTPITPPQNITCYSNADCGIDGFIDQPFCIGNSIVQEFQAFVCNNPGTTSSACLVSVSLIPVQDCPFSCSNATCINPPTISCYSNSECGDGNPLTFDQCNNPGTSSSYCSYIPIACASNADCGFTGFIGTEFCTLNDIFKNFQTAVCNSPSTLSASCSVSIAPQFLNSCQFACTQGICIPCNENSDCNDNNANTQDTCNNPGTTSSYCTHTPITPPPVIACYSNSDCNDNNANTQDTCNNPGTTSSYCTHTPITPPPSCTNDCSIGQRICAGASGYKICGNFDSDSCLDWSLINQCGIGQTCTGAGNCG